MFLKWNKRRTADIRELSSVLNTGSEFKISESKNSKGYPNQIHQPTVGAPIGNWYTSLVKKKKVRPEKCKLGTQLHR